MLLSEAARGRDNNLNLLRFVAAFAVLVSHAFVLATGHEDTEPLRTWLGMTPGSIAVDVFFLASGFLVTGSLLRSGSAVDYLWARCLRIFPGLWVMLLLTVFVLGPAVSTLTPRDYFADSLTYTYLLKCATLLGGVSYSLPGVFADNPYKEAVNGSLWTMPYEVRMYVVLLGVWLLSRLAGRHRDLLCRAALLGIALVSAALTVRYLLRGGSGPSERWLFFMFFTGSAFQVLRERIRLSDRAFALGALALLACAALASKLVFTLAYMLLVPFLVFWLAYVPGGLLRRYNAVGDYSYGIYVYAFPVQQTLVHLWPGLSVAGLLCASAVVTLALAVASWHALEQRALGLKAHAVRLTWRV